MVLRLLHGVFIPGLLVRTQDLVVHLLLFLCFKIFGITFYKLIASVCDSIDMALHLLKSTPTLATALDTNGESPLVALACMSFAYPSGNRLIFWKQWIYKSEYYSLFSYLRLN